MFSKVGSSVIIGIEAVEVHVEVDVAHGTPHFAIVGLPDAAVRESIKRVRSAIRNSSFRFPNEKITVNLSPADIKKGGPCFDLPIALGILSATGHVAQEKLNNKIVCGELSLDGGVRPIKGALPRSLLLKNGKELILPRKNAREAAIVKNSRVYPVERLEEVVDFLNGEASIKPAQINIKRIWQLSEKYTVDFSDVKGQEHVKRGLEIAAAGGHNVLLIGPPGTGKTMLAKRLPTILSEMNMEEALETTKIYSATGKLATRNILIAKRPFRAPHHTISDVALVGGGSPLVPGEISLAHNGVLFLDELPEFKRNALEALRQPMELGEVAISRVESSAVFPARFMLVASMNPCPCGHFTDKEKECHCSPIQIQRYLSKISGPLLDRIDIHLNVSRLNYQDLFGKRAGETSSAIRERVDKTRLAQAKRYNSETVFFNAHLESKSLEQYCALDKEGEELLKMAILELSISARAYDKILKVGRTIADLEGKEAIETSHLSEAISYRGLDNTLWAY